VLAPGSGLPGFGIIILRNRSWKSRSLLAVSRRPKRMIHLIVEGTID
jgi:hypothetical protein